VSIGAAAFGRTYGVGYGSYPFFMIFANFGTFTLKAIASEIFIVLLNIPAVCYILIKRLL
jgi:hypothetical protein